MALTTVRNTNQETIIHFQSSAIETGTITIAGLAASTQALTSGGTPTVNIIRFVATGEDTASVTVMRNTNKVLIACAPENAPILDLTSMGITESQYNTTDIIISNNVAKQVTGYITLRKVSGWDNKVENATYGSYDDPTRVGARTDVSGSPDNA